MRLELVFPSASADEMLLRMEKLMGQYEDLKAAVSQLGTDLGEAIGRVEAKIVALGNPDPDLTADIAALRDASSKLDAMAVDEPAPAEPPAEPAPAEPPVEQPAPPVEPEPTA